MKKKIRVRRYLSIHCVKENANIIVCLHNGVTRRATCLKTVNCAQYKTLSGMDGHITEIAEMIIEQWTKQYERKSDIKVYRCW